MNEPLSRIWSENKYRFPDGISVSIGPDGSRRWAKMNRFSVRKGHEMGAKKIEELIRFIHEQFEGIITEVTFWYKSAQNMTNRSSEENLGLASILQTYESILMELAEDVGGQIIPFGDFDILSETEREVFQRLELGTKHYTQLKIGIAAAYSQRLYLTKMLGMLFYSHPDFKSFPLKKQLEIALNTMHKGLREPDLFVFTGAATGVRERGAFIGENTHFVPKNIYWPDVDGDLVVNAIIDMLLHSKIKNGT